MRWQALPQPFHLKARLMMQIPERLQAGHLGSLGQRRSAALPLPAALHSRQPCLSFNIARSGKRNTTCWKGGNSHERAAQGICHGLSQVLLQGVWACVYYAAWSALLGVHTPCTWCAGLSLVKWVHNSCCVLEFWCVKLQAYHQCAAVVSNWPLALAR